MASTSQVAQIEKKVRRIERDLASIRFALQRLRAKRKTPRLDALQKSIARHLVSDEDPAQVLEKMRHRNSQ